MQREGEMTEKQNYECEDCGKRIEINPDESGAPQCCNKPMKKAEPLDACQKSSTAEHSRFDDFGEPCDDGRSGKI